MKNKDLKLDFGSLKASATKAMPLLNKHGAFMLIILVLLVYLFVVWRISSLASAEPSDTDLQTATTSANIPTIDKKSIDQIQKLEENNVQVKSLFNEARNNPF